MAHNTSSNEQGRHGAPLTPHESAALTDIGTWLAKEDPELARTLGPVEPTARPPHGPRTLLKWVLTCAVLAPLVVYGGVRLGDLAFSRAIPAFTVAIVLGSIGLATLECLWLVMCDGDPHN